MRAVWVKVGDRSRYPSCGVRVVALEKVIAVEGLSKQ
jgi:hypothetical protein